MAFYQHFITIEKDQRTIELTIFHGPTLHARQVALHRVDVYGPHEEPCVRAP
jgi:hypothetical protein